MLKVTNSLPSAHAPHPIAAELNTGLEVDRREHSGVRVEVGDEADHAIGRTSADALASLAEATAI